eukprot:TRINITY_DN28461_c0_g1_i1.p1 TRINITY_DN28461_c0_g1~~TRINITY_DN28461_c0_g1_i1.p1  ORF type:complete len:1585 (+),score=645.51 TRINITY_DN28461_c0_g1_i1:50-4804(+)
MSDLRTGARLAQRYHHHGALDSWLGIDRFWTEKWLLLWLWAQDFALLWMWPTRWPWHFWGRSHFMLYTVLDFRTRRWQMTECEPCFGSWPNCEPDGCTFTLGLLNGTLLSEYHEPEQNTIGTLFAIGGGSALFLLWFALSMVPDTGLLGPALAHNIERLMVPLLTVLYTPFLLVCFYTVCDLKSFTVEQWQCSPNHSSIFWTLLGAVYAVGFPALVFHRVKLHNVFRSRLRHETMLRTRELEYVLRLNTVFRDRRLWLQSSFTQEGAYTLNYQLMHKMVIVLLLAVSRSSWAIAAWERDEQNLESAPELLPNWDGPTIKTLTCVVVLMFFVPAVVLSTGLVRLYRVWTTQLVAILFLWGNTINAVIGWLNVLEVKNPLLVDKDARILLAWLNFAIVCAFLAQLGFFYYWTHDFVSVLPCWRGGAADRERDKLSGSKRKGALMQSETNAIHMHLGRSLPLIIQERMRERRLEKGFSFGNVAPLRSGSATSQPKPAPALPDRAEVKWTPLPVDWPLKLPEPEECSSPGHAPPAVLISPTAGSHSAGVHVTLRAGVRAEPAPFAQLLLEFVEGLTEANVVVDYVDDPELLVEKLRVRFMGGAGEPDREGAAAKAAVAFVRRCADADDTLAQDLGVEEAELEDPAATEAAAERHAAAEAGGDDLHFEGVGTERSSETEAREAPSPDGLGDRMESMSVGDDAAKQSEGSGEKEPSLCGSEYYEMQMLNNLKGKDLTDAELFGDYWGDDDGDDLIDYDKGYLFFPPSTNVAFTWPVGRSLVAEIIRENRTNHFLDVLREAGAVLMEVTFLHTTPELVRAETLLFHVRRIRRCLRQCNKLRVVHHIHAIHPLAPTFEEVLDDLVYELKIHKDTAMAVGARATKLPIVSAFLHHRMNDREEYMILFSPMMRRMLLKLLVLRMFQQLVKGSSDKLLPGGKRMSKQSEGDDFAMNAFEAWGALAGREGTGTASDGQSPAPDPLAARHMTDATSATCESALVDAGGGEEFTFKDGNRLWVPEFVEFGLLVEEDEDIERVQLEGEEDVRRQDAYVAAQWSARGAQRAVDRRREYDARTLHERKQLEKHQMDEYHGIRQDEEMEWEVWRELLEEIHKDAAEDSHRHMERAAVEDEGTAERDRVEREEAEEMAGIEKMRHMDLMRCADKQELRQLEQRRERELAEQREADRERETQEAELAQQEQEQESKRKASEKKQRKKWLTVRLNRWKQSYKESHGKEATKKAFEADPAAAPMWHEYQAIRDDRWLAPGKWTEPEAGAASPKSAMSPAGGSEGDGEARSPAPSPTPESPERMLRRRKKELAGLLNKWKAEYKAKHEQDPTKKVLRSDPSVAGLYAEYQALLGGTWQEEYGEAAAEATRRQESGQAPAEAAPPAEAAAPPAPAPAAAAQPQPAEPAAASAAAAKKRKKELASQLNAWKAAYKAEHGSDPTKKTLNSDPSVAPLYAEYQSFAAGTWAEQYGAPAPEPAAAPAPPAEERGRPEEPSLTGGRKRERSRRREVAAALNDWKQRYREEHGKDPTKKILRDDPTVAPLYEEFLALQAAKAERRQSAAPTPEPPSEDAAKPATAPDAGGEDEA